MKLIRTSILALAATALASGAFAQSNTNAQRCQNLSQEVQASFQNSVQARVPKTDPTSFNQDGYDIKGIMSQDVTAGLGKLLSLDFSGIIDSVVNKGLEKATQRATANFSQRMNSVLNGVGLQGMNFQSTPSGPAGLHVTPPKLNTPMPGLTPTPNIIKPPVTPGTKPAGPYGRP
jgi:hypothetical protein